MTKKPDFNRLYQIAEAQAGYFTTKQAHEASYSRERLSDLTAREQFIRVQRGIYRLSHFPASRFEDLFIAFLRTGPDSVISHDSALAVYDLSDVLPGEIHVIMPRTGSRRRNGIRLHTNKIDIDEITEREGLPITTPSRTIVDVITNGLGSDLVRQAVDEAIKKGLVTKVSLTVLICTTRSRLYVYHLGVWQNASRLRSGGDRHEEETHESHTGYHPAITTGRE